MTGYLRLALGAAAIVGVSFGTLGTSHATGALAERVDGSGPAQFVAETGIASYYGKYHHGKRTASGDRFDQHGLTAAHPWLPFGTEVRVTVASTGQSVVVTITDRIYSRTRIADLSTGAAKALGILRQGIARVTLEPA